MPITNTKPFEMLVAQLGKEMGNFLFYKRIAAHYAGKNWNGFKKYFSGAAEEEMEHFQKVFDYLDKKQYSFIPPMPVDRPLPADMTEESIFAARLALEEGTTAEWNAIYETAKGRYGIVPDKGRQVYKETDKCEPSVVETIAAEFIAIQYAEEEEAHNALAKVRMTKDMHLLDEYFGSV